MGLLEKSTKYNEERPAGGEGLLARASAAAEEETENSSADPSGNVGLLARAEEFQSIPEEPTVATGPIADDTEPDADAGELISDAELEAELDFLEDSTEDGGDAPAADVDEAAEAYDDLMGADDRDSEAYAAAEVELNPEHGLLARAESMSVPAEAKTEAIAGEPAESPDGAGPGLLARAEELQTESSEPVGEESLAEYANVDDGQVLEDDLLPELDFSEEEQAAPEAAPSGLLARAEELQDGGTIVSEDGAGAVAADLPEHLAPEPDESGLENEYADFATVDHGEVLDDELLPDLDFEEPAADASADGAATAESDSSGGLLARAESLAAGEAAASTPEADESPLSAATTSALDEIEEEGIIEEPSESAGEEPAALGDDDLELPPVDDHFDENAGDVDLDSRLEPEASGELAPGESADDKGDLDDMELVAPPLDENLVPEEIATGAADDLPADDLMTEPLAGAETAGESVTADAGEEPLAAMDEDALDIDFDAGVDLEDHGDAEVSAAESRESDEPVLLDSDGGDTASSDATHRSVDEDGQVALFETDSSDEEQGEDDIDLDADLDLASGPGSAAGADEEGGLPAWDYEGPDSPDDDPFLLDNAAAVEEKLFEDWEDEAEYEAERGIKELEGRPVQAETRHEIMLEADSEFTTVPDEVHIASQKKIDNYLSLFDITKEISTIDDFDNLWDAILYAAMGQVGAETICIFSTTTRGTDSQFEPVAHSGFTLPDGWSLRPGDRIYDTLIGQPEIKYAQEFLQGSLAGQEKQILETTRADIVVPLKNQERTYGILVLGSQLSGDEYGLDDLEFLNLLGEISAVGVDRVLSRLEYEQDTGDLKRRTKIHKKIFELSRQTSNARTIDEIYDMLSEHLIEDFQVESFSLVLLEAREQDYRIFAGNQISPASIEKFSLGVSADLVGMISNLTHVYELTDFRENQEITRNYTNDDLGLMQNYWIVPLINLNWLVGFLTIHKTARSWSDFQREMLVTLAEIMAPVFANSIILGERETLFRDPFSPLESRLRAELKKAAQFQAPVSLVEIRVKNIKRLLALNPAESVSEFLTLLGRSIAGFLFESDFVARIGQGRFALILPGRGGEEAEIFVKKLRSEFKRVGMLPGSPIDVQYSHQIITAPHDTDDPEKILSMLD